MLAPDEPAPLRVAAKRRKPKAPSDDKPAVEQVSREDAQRLIAEASGGRYVSSPPGKAGVFPLDRARKADGERAGAAGGALGDTFRRVGRWLAAGGDAWKAGRLDGRQLGASLDAWIAQALAWDGRSPVVAEKRYGGGAAPAPARAMNDASAQRLQDLFTVRDEG